MKNLFAFLAIAFFFFSCMDRAERNCSDFKTGTFEYSYLDGDKIVTSSFTRNDSIEIDYFEDRIDTVSVRWINDCEYVMRSINPKTLSEKKAVHFKILSTTENSYTFEYSFVVKTTKSDYKKYRGTVYKKN